MSNLNVNIKPECKETPNHDLRNKVINGTTWNIYQLLISSGFKYIVQLILAYLIAPEAFGYIGMATVFISLVDTINDLGLGPALIQKKSDQLNETHYCTVFWITMGFAIVTFLVMVIFLSPLIAKFYGEPILRPVIILLCVPILLRPSTLIHRIKLIKEINFKPIALIESLGAIVGGIAAIIMAYMGFGVWSIALQGTVSALVTIPSMWKVVKWRPQKVFSRQAFNDVFNFGIFIMIKNLCTTFMDNVDYLLIGRMLNSYSVGVYTFAFLLTDVARKQIMGIMNKVMFPVYAKVQGQPKVIGAYYLKVIKYNTIILIPFMMGMLVFVESLIDIIYKGKWIDSVLPIQILSLAVMFHVATGTFSTVLTGIGKAKDDFIIYFIKTVLLYLPLLIFMIRREGIIGAATAVLIYKCFSFLINLFLTKYYIKVRPIEILKSIVPSIFSALMIFITYNLIKSKMGLPANMYELMLFSIIIGIVYLISIYPFAKSEAKAIWGWLWNKLSKKTYV